MTNQPVEWRLYDTDLSTQLAILLVIDSNLLIELNEPGSGSLTLPADSVSAPLCTSGRFCGCFYRGAFRGGFFIDNIDKTDVDSSEFSGRAIKLSGRGALALLEDAIIWDDGSGAVTREFSSSTKADILITLIDEAQARGALSNLSYDFTASLDSASASWTDSEDMALDVGTSILDTARAFARTGEFDFSLSLVGGSFVLSAYKSGIGTDVSETIFFRSGLNCEELSTTTRGDKITNAMRVKYRDGLISVSDATSISANRRRESFLNIEQAQSSSSASTFAAAKLENLKDPRKGISIKAYDGVSPYLFDDYVLGDTVVVDAFGTENDWRILGIQINFKDDLFSEVVLELNTLFYDRELDIDETLTDLINRWNTARDSDLLEVNTLVPWGDLTSPVAEGVWSIIEDGGIIYVGGEFSGIVGKTTTPNVASYNPATGTWSDMASGLPSFRVTTLFAFGGEIYAGSNAAAGIWKWDGSTWTNMLSNTTVWPYSRTWDFFTDGSTIYAAGEFQWVPIASTLYAGIIRVEVGAWVGWDSNGFDVGRHSYTGAFLNGTLYKANDVDFYNLNGVAQFATTTPTLKMHAVGSTLYLIGTKTAGWDLFASWDEVAADRTELVTISTGNFNEIASNLSDVYVFTDYDNYGGILKWSAGNVEALGPELTGGANKVMAGAWYNDIFYLGGVITEIEGQSSGDLVVYTQSFAQYLEHIQTQSTFDLAGAIHGATASAVTDNDEFVFWEDVSTAIRKITWANIKATLKTYFDTLYVALTGTQTIAGTKTFSSFPVTPSSPPTTDYEVANKKYVDDNAGGAGTSGWAESALTWTRTGNHTFTVPGDETATFRAGTKVRYKDGGGYEYGVVLSSTFGAVTTVTLITNTDYTMAAATITEPATSALQNPEAFPHTFNYTATWNNLTVGNGTFYAKWQVDGRHIHNRAGFKFGSTSAITGTLNLVPIVTPDALGTTQEHFGEATIRDTGTALYNGTCYLIGGNLYPQVSAASGSWSAPSNITSTVPMTWTTNDELSIDSFYDF